MISLTSEYALRAMIYLAQRVEQWPVSGRTVAEDTGIPRKYLQTILSDLVRARILDSSPGRGGGFSMVRSPQEVMLSEVLAPFEQMPGSRRTCPFGHEECNDEDPCPAHEGWKGVCEQYAHFLKHTSVHGIAFDARGSDGGKSTKGTKG